MQFKLYSSPFLCQRFSGLSGNKWHLIANFFSFNEKDHLGNIADIEFDGLLEQNQPLTWGQRTIITALLELGSQIDPDRITPGKHAQNLGRLWRQALEFEAEWTGQGRLDQVADMIGQEFLPRQKVQLGLDTMIGGGWKKDHIWLEFLRRQKIQQQR